MLMIDMLLSLNIFLKFKTVAILYYVYILSFSRLLIPFLNISPIFKIFFAEVIHR